MSKGMLIDITKCIGCRACQNACKQWNDLPVLPTPSQEGTFDSLETDAYNWTRVGFHKVEINGKVQWRFAKRQCMHCNEPACESACFVHAFVKTPEGPVVYKENLCVGCRYCMLACPFQVPKYEWDKAFPLVRKCRMCYDRLQEGMEPACTTACPTGANIFGDRDELLAEAKNRIKNNPDKYIDHVYGEKEVGGTSVLYLSDIPFEELGFRTDVTTRGIPQYTWSVLKWTPHIAIGWTAVLTALYMYTKRRVDADEEDEH
ncbi:MAG: 4Fe-4S dicluster domain-containing protein [Peptococcaceae bacterium]|nr:4Fe-4S dicluster domain-containing protein [Peptococcaceae bacterium]